MTTESVGLLYMLTNAGPVVKFIMLLLLFFSIISWSIIFIKFRYVRNSFRDSADFTEVFWQCRTLADAFSKAKALRSSPLARLFLAAYMEAARTESKENLSARKNTGSTLQTMGSVKRTLNRAINVENRRLSQLVSFLATAGNTAPFIGLFGTVWGIMSTF
ncbi:MotA/TolQ/ExbB proton channel family protein, partial [Desulfobacter sp.]|uniref:MotA/TolQ/ExbB proton channel family protein n=1 Tax=Desulfobacter sp. TaxID=2294 RepID=UPI003D0C9382